MFNLKQFIEKIVYKFDIIIKEQNITLEMNCEDNLEIKADINLLENVIDNYLTNVISFLDFDKIIKIDIFNTSYNIKEEELDKI